MRISDWSSDVCSSDLGIRTMRQVLATRGLDYVPPASNLEARFEQILLQAGEAPMRRQVDIGDGDRWIGRVDFRDADLPLLVEIPSERFTAGLIDKQQIGSASCRESECQYV